MSYTVLKFGDLKLCKPMIVGIVNTQRDLNYNFRGKNHKIILKKDIKYYFHLVYLLKWLKFEKVFLCHKQFLIVSDQCLKSASFLPLGLSQCSFCFSLLLANTSPS